MRCTAMTQNTKAATHAQASPQAYSLRLSIFLLSAFLAIVAIPASTARVLVPNDDSLCVLFSAALFGTVALSSLAIKRRMRVLFALFLVALLLQFWALHWVESGPFFRLALIQGTFSLRLWTSAYILSSTGVVVAILVTTYNHAVVYLNAEHPSE